MAGKTRKPDPVDIPASPSRKVSRRKRKLAPGERLEKLPGSFAFAQAIDLVKRRLRQEGVDDPDKAILFRVNPNLSFPAGDIESITFHGESHETRAEVILNLMGLHGSASPIPAYFTEFVAQHQDGQNTLRDFFDIFNHRLVSILYEVWQKYRYYRRYERDSRDTLSGYFLGFIGMGQKDMRRSSHLHWVRLLAYAGLISFKKNAVGSMESVLQHYFSHRALAIIPCIPRSVEIPEDQLNRLGQANSSLSINCLIGFSVPDQTSKFRIRIYSLNWERFNAFLPDGRIFSELKSLVRFTMPTRLIFDVELCLLPEDIPPMRIGKQSLNRLGWSSWLGDPGEGIVLLEPNHEEFVPC